MHVSAVTHYILSNVTTLQEFYHTVFNVSCEPYFGHAVYVHSCIDMFVIVEFTGKDSLLLKCYSPSEPVPITISAFS